MKSSTNDTVNSYRLALADNKGVYYFMLKQIVRLEANNVYTTVYFDGYPPFTVSKVLGTYDELLKPFGFIRTHRSHVVNRDFVKCITSHRIIMQDASVAELARRKKQEVMKQLATSILDITNAACFT